MNFIIQSFYTFLYQPLLNGLVLLYFLTHDLGLAVFILTLLVRLVLFPLSFKGLKSQQAMKTIEPKIRELKQKHKDNIPEQNRAVMELYKQEKVSPVSGCLPLLIQFPIIIALYRVFYNGLNIESFNKFLYSFVPNPGEIPLKIFWLFDANSKIFIIVLALLAAVLQFWQSKMTMPKGQKKPTGTDFASAMQKQMLYIFPVITFFIIYKTGVVVGAYWFFSVLFSLLEQAIIARTAKNK